MMPPEEWMIVHRKLCSHFPERLAEADDSVLDEYRSALAYTGSSIAIESIEALAERTEEPSPSQLTAMIQRIREDRKHRPPASEKDREDGLKDREMELQAERNAVRDHLETLSPDLLEAHWLLLMAANRTLRWMGPRGAMQNPASRYAVSASIQRGVDPDGNVGLEWRGDGGNLVELSDRDMAEARLALDSQPSGPGSFSASDFSPGKHSAHPVEKTDAPKIPDPSDPGRWMVIRPSGESWSAGSASELASHLRISVPALMRWIAADKPVNGNRVHFEPQVAK